MRINPAAGPQHYTSFGIAAPLQTHWRRATCEEARCPAFLGGWRVRIDARRDPGIGQAHYLRKDRTRQGTEERDEQGMAVFTFPPGTPCLRVADHRIRIDRPELYLIRGGDHRGNPLGVPTRRYDRPAPWLEQFAENQERLRHLKEG